MKKIKGRITAALLILFIALAGCSKDKDIVYKDIKTLEIGALIPLTGDADNNGASMLKALQLAEQDINATLEAQNSATRFRLVYSDSQTDAKSCDILSASMITQGIRFIIGPMTSNEMVGITDTINDSSSLLISPSSTLPTLAVADDNIYRFVSDAGKMTNAIADVLWHKGIRHLVVLYRDDEWGTALAEAVMDRFEAKGGTVIESDSYFTLRQSLLQDALDNLSDMVKNKLKNADPETIGLQLISLGEGIDIMETAARDTVFGQIKWFGSDGFVQVSIEDGSQDAARLALQTNYTAPIFGVNLTSDGETLKTKIETAVDSSINIYPLISYDAFMVAANTLLAVGDDVSLESMRTQFLSEINAYRGAVEDISLNSAGDLADGDYYFWSVIEDNGEYAWQQTWTYSNGQISSEINGKILTGKAYYLR